MCETYIQVRHAGLRVQTQHREVGESQGPRGELGRSHGKGSHGRISLGNKSTTLKDLKKDIGPGLLNAMCKQLGITAEELNDALGAGGSA